MRKKGIPEVLVRSVMSLYEGAKTRVRLDSELYDDLVLLRETIEGLRNKILKWMDSF